MNEARSLRAFFLAKGRPSDTKEVIGSRHKER
jgi:hypothetical protein